jgi:DNA-binding SARP family transcriptional activator
MYEIGSRTVLWEPHAAPRSMNTRSEPPPSDAPPPDSIHAGRTPELPYGLVFERFPSGIIVVDFAGRVVGHNASARGLLGAALERSPLRCDDLFGCRRPGTPLEGACITALALERPGPLPEMRLDVETHPGQTVGVWVTAASIGGADAAVVFQLRAGMLGDRRRRTEPHWMGGAELRVFTLGRTRVESGEGPMGGEWLAHRPGELFKYLVTERGRIVPLEELVDAFWAHAGRGGATNVRQAVHSLRERLEPRRIKHAPSAFIQARKGGYELDQENVWIDAEEFEAAARAGLDALRRSDLEVVRPALERAAQLYRGDFLADEPYAEYALAERDRLRDLAGQVLRALARVEREADNLDLTTEHLQRVAELEPLDLDAQRDLLAVLVERGRHQEAARRYEVVRRRYRRAFGEDPELQLTDIVADPAG